MVYELNWLVPNRVLEMTMSGDIRAEEMRAMYREHIELVREEGLTPVHVLLDGRGIENLQIRIHEINTFLDSSATDLFGWTIIVTNNRFMKFLVVIFSKMTGSQFKTVDSYDEALMILKKQVPDIMQYRS